MMSSNGNIFHLTRPLWWESPGHRWIPLTKASDVEFWCFLWSLPEQMVEQTIEIEMPPCSSWRHCNDMILSPIYRQVSNIRRQLNCWSLRCSWSIACRRCSNYIFILCLTPGFSRLGKDKGKTRRESFRFWDLVRLILEILRVLLHWMKYMVINSWYQTTTKHNKTWTVRIFLGPTLHESTIMVTTPMSNMLLPHFISVGIIWSACCHGNI